jgi:hypothetical protein
VHRGANGEQDLRARHAASIRIDDAAAKLAGGRGNGGDEDEQKGQ